MIIVSLPSVSRLKYAILRFIDDGATASKVRRHVNAMQPMTRGNFYAILKSLDRDGLIEKRQLNNNRLFVVLTDRGRQAVQEFRDFAK